MWKEVEFRTTGDTAKFEGNQQGYLDYLNNVTFQIVSQTAGQLELDDGRIIELDDYHEGLPGEKRRPHPNPNCGFQVWKNETRFYKFAKGRRIILWAHGYTTYC